MNTTDHLTDQQLDEIDARANALNALGIPGGTWTASPRDEKSVFPPEMAHVVEDVLCTKTAKLRSSVGVFGDQAHAEFAAHAREDVRLLLAEVRRLHNELAEEKAAHNPRLRCLLLKATPDRDLYIGWSNTCDMPAGVWSRETAIEYGFPPSRLDRADETGTSSHHGDGAWDDPGFVAEQRGWLRRDRLGDYAVEYMHGDMQAAFDLLEPFEGETEVRR